MDVEHITDTHLHVVDRGRLNYPWLSDAPPLNRDWPVEDYETEARRVGIDRALHMEVDVAAGDMEAETAYIDELAGREGSIIAGIIAACRPEEDGFAAEIERAQARRRVVGFRRVLHVVPDELSQGETFRANIRRLAAADLPFDICVAARQLPLAIELVDAAPQTRFVLDHCGVPDIAGGGWEAWARDVAAIAERPNVSAKVSGVVAYAAQDWTADELARWVGHVVESFGFERLVWGGDWPVCTLGGGLSTWVAATRAMFAAASGDERAALYRRNAERIWKL